MTAVKKQIQKRGLGRGLGALFEDEEAQNFTTPLEYPESGKAAGNASGRYHLRVDQLQPGQFQPRRRFDDEALKQLTASIKAHGVLQPLLVRPLLGQKDKFEIIAGERRWRASQAAKIHELPVVIQNLSDGATLEIALIENLQREDLTPLEEAEGYQSLIDEFNYTQEELAKNLGKSRSYIANTLRLLSLSDGVKKLLQDGKLTAGHARALLTSKNQQALAEKIVKQGLSVRQVEYLAQKAANETGKDTTATKSAKSKDVDTLALEEEMSSLLGLSVSIDSRGTGGMISISYRTLDQLDDILQRLSRKDKK